LAIPHHYTQGRRVWVFRVFHLSRLKLKLNQKLLTSRDSNSNSRRSCSIDLDSNSHICCSHTSIRLTHSLDAAHDSIGLNYNSNSIEMTQTHLPWLYRNVSVEVIITRYVHHDEKLYLVFIQFYISVFTVKTNLLESAISPNLGAKHLQMQKKYTETVHKIPIRIYVKREIYVIASCTHRKNSFMYYITGYKVEVSSDCKKVINRCLARLYIRQPWLLLQVKRSLLSPESILS
jgi:hypothetical protein